MPSLQTLAENSPAKTLQELAKRISIKVTSHSPPGLIAASKQDPWSKSGKYALGWVYFSVILLVFTMAIHWYRYWTDKIRRATFKEEVAKSSKTSSPDSDYEMANLPTNCSSRKFFPGQGDLPQQHKEDELPSFSFGPFDKLTALVRFVAYRPLPILRYKRQEFQFPGAGVIFIVVAATAFVTLYSFLPQPLFYASIEYGSPPLAIRAGMIAVAMMPWTIALSMKANLISVITGLGHERLNVLHRWAAYIMLFLSLVHTVPFYITPVWDETNLNTFKNYFGTGYYPYGSGWAALAPLLALIVHSLPFIRKWAYELFVITHVPISIVFLGMLFWHCHNYLTSWNYLWATTAIWLASYLTRLFYLNWTNPFRMSWLIGDAASVTILPENAVKVTVATKVKWSPGQYVYLRMPGISVFENHPFTIASLCSEDFESQYQEGEGYRDMTLVFRPFGGFTRKVLESGMQNLERGEDKTYRAFIDGPYGGMRRDLASFDTVILFAGGSGITAIVSHLLDLIKKMRDSKAVTKRVYLVWALKRPETMEWFKEEIRICREFAPPESVHCRFFITAAKRQIPGQAPFPPSPSRPLHDLLHKQIDNTFQGIASKRSSALIQDASGGDPEKARELRAENEDAITGLPHPTFLPPPKKALQNPHRKNKPSLTIPTQNLTVPTQQSTGSNFDFGFPSTPTMLQKNLMRFAFMPALNPKKSSWSTEYGRPDIPYMLKGFEREFGRRTCVFVCGPPSMRVDVQRVVAGMQRGVWSGSEREELFLHTENYAI
ncbi:hypothetical protein MMC21_007035 [Puttea exsequens]|nr:hypothetical protein [Puttea exsequens]